MGSLMKIEKNKVVKIEYRLTDKEGTVIDSSENREPLAFIQGSGQIIVGLEKELFGKEAGDSFDVKIAPKDGYGERDDEKIRRISRSQLSGIDKIEVGMQLHGEDDKGNQAIFTVTAQDNDDVTLDGNHPLAGQDLFFAIKVVEVREASSEELDHGHVHGEGGHSH